MVGRGEFEFRMSRGVGYERMGECERMGWGDWIV